MTEIYLLFIGEQYVGQRNWATACPEQERP